MDTSVAFAFLFLLSAIWTLALRSELKRRRGAERELALLNAAIGRVPETIYLIDADACIRYVNDEPCRVLGYTRDELVGMRLAQIDPAVSIAAWQHAWAQLAVTRHRVLESRHFRRDGSSFPVEINVHLIDFEGKAYSLCFVRDISKRKMNESRIALLDLAVEHMREAVYVSDADCRIHYANAEASRMLGFTRDELMAMTVFDIDDQLNRDVADSIIRGARPQPRTIERTHRTKDGRIVPVELVLTGFNYEGRACGISLVRDITERKAAEQKLQASERAFRALVENSPDLIVRYDRDCRRLYANPAACKAMGATAEQVLEGTPMDNASLHDPAQYVETIRKAFKTGRPTTAEGRYRIEENWRWIHVSMVPELDADNRVASVLVTARDIDELKKSEQRFRTLADNMPDCVVRYDCHGRTTYVNSRAVETFTTAPDAAPVGKTMAEFLPGEQGLHYHACVMHALEERAPVTKHLTLSCADGDERHLEILIVPEFDDTDNVVGALAIAHDVTADRRAERELVLLNRAVDRSHDAIYLIDDDLRLRYSNEAVVRMLGYSRPELASMRVTDIVPDSTREQVLELMHGNAPDGLPGTVESRHRAKGGRIFPVEIGASAIDYHGETLFVTVVRDISERKQVERRLRESYDLLQELSARRDSAREEEKGRMAREIHDELGQQLTALHLGLATLEMDLDNGPPRVLQEVRRLMNMTDGTIRTVRNIATALRPAVLDSGIGPALEWLVSQFQRQTGVRCPLILSCVPPQLDAYRAAALFRIAQESLTNIARHADATDASICLAFADGSGRMEIRDNGRGFNPGTDGQRTLGLIGMRERALMLRGEIAIDSTPDVGTKICITIPMKKEEEIR